MSAGTSSGLAALKAENGGLPDNFPVGMKVLLVDDDVTCLAVVKRMLLNCQYNVTTCSQATKALSLLREDKSAFDLIVSDVHMPDMDGFRLLELVGLEMDLPVIMMSADTRFNIVMKGIRHGACDFLIKPVRMSELQNIWQHVVRRKWFDNKETEHSGSMEESDRNRPVTDDSEFTSVVNDGTEGYSRSQKKKRDSKEEDDTDFDNTDPSSSKKPRVVWSVELHQQFVNAVNQLGIDKAVPKRILELMNVPGLTRENVASHLQKFRLYLKRLSGVAQHQNGLASSFFGVPPNSKSSQLAKPDLHALAISGQIPPETLAALQDELLGHPSRNITVPAINQPVLRQSSAQGSKPVTVEPGITFGQPLLKGQSISSFPLWPSNGIHTVGSTSNISGLSISQDGNMLETMLPHQQPHPVLSESHTLNVQPSCLLVSNVSSTSFKPKEGSMLLNQDSLLVPSQPSSTFQAGKTSVPSNQNSIIVAAHSSTSMQTRSNPVVINENSMIMPSQSLTSISVGNNSRLLNQSSIIIPSRPLTSFQAMSNPHLINQNAMVVPSSATIQAENGVVPITHNASLNASGPIVNYCRISSQLNTVPTNLVQALDGGFNNVALVNSYSTPVSISSSVSSCTNGNNSWRVQSPDGNVGYSNGSPSVAPNSSNTQASSRLFGKLPDQVQGRTLGFVGKGTCLPSRFAADDIDSPTGDLTHITCSGDEGYLLNQDNFGFSGTFQSDHCATSFK